jgi:hypothetical protein
MIVDTLDFHDGQQFAAASVPNILQILQSLPTATKEHETRFVIDQTMHNPNAIRLANHDTLQGAHF